VTSLSSGANLNPNSLLPIFVSRSRTTAGRPGSIEVGSEEVEERWIISESLASA